MFFLASSSNALTIDPSDYNGSQSANFGFGQIEAGDQKSSVLANKEVDGKTATGVTSDTESVAGEIDGKEYINFDFNNDVTIKDFKISFLFGSGNFGDTVDEVAKIQINDEESFTLKAKNTPDKYNWTGTGSVDVVSYPNSNNAGIFKVTNPFDESFDQNVGSLKFLSGAPKGNDSSLSDYAIQDVNTAPEPTTMLLFGTGLLGLAGLGRKKFFNKS